MSARPSFLQAALASPPSPKPAPAAPAPSVVAGAEAVKVSFESLESIRTSLDGLLSRMYTVKSIPQTLQAFVATIRNELEPVGGPTPASNGFRRGVQPPTGAPTRSFGGNGGAGGWRSGTGGGGNGFQQQSRYGGPPARQQSAPFGTSHTSRQQSAYTTENGVSSLTPSPMTRYQSRFKNGSENLQDKILNSIIGNKLNTFSPVTYNDVRDFIYQILDSGETEFIQDFVAKVFQKATQEDIYCALFAKFLSEISSRYSIIRNVMLSYHTEFLKVFDDVQESNDVAYETLVKQKQFRMGYGQFMSDLAGTNTLEPACLYAMTSKLVEGIDKYSKEEDKTKLVEEFVDCYVRMMKALKQKNLSFFSTVQKQLAQETNPVIIPLVDRAAGPRPSLSSKARFGLMDLRDILAAN
jgi:hypothetical protein